MKNLLYDLLISSGEYLFPERLLTDGTKLHIFTKRLGPQGTAVTVHVTDRDEKTTFISVELPDFYISQLLEEYVAQTLGSMGFNTMSTLGKAHAQLTKARKSCYTTKNEPENNTNRPEFDGDAPQLQASGVLEPLLPGQQWVNSITTRSTTGQTATVPSSWQRSTSHITAADAERVNRIIGRADTTQSPGVLGGPERNG